MNRRYVGILACLMLWPVVNVRTSRAAEGESPAALQTARAALLAAFPGRVNILLVEHYTSKGAINQVRLMDVAQLGGTTFLVVQDSMGSTSYINAAEVFRINAVREAATRGTAPAPTPPAVQVER